MSLPFDNSYARLPDHFYRRVAPARVASPQTVVINERLIDELGLSRHDFEDARLADYLSGNALFEGSEPIALAYAGHQFGGFVPQLGDGRAHLLGELLTPDGKRWDLQLKGSGPTPFSRGGDGRAALGPVLREYLVSESMHALGIPTTRSLGVATTGEPVYRQTPLPGAVLARVAASHLRVGTFEYFLARGDVEALATLTNYALDRHFPDARDGRLPAETLLDSVIEAQAALVSKWMGVGFVHGVMNTDNCTISGETIDYGPCAFLDSYDPDRCFSSIDRAGRYAYARQPQILHWNMARFAETLLPLLGPTEEEAVGRAKEVLHRYPERLERHVRAVTSAKLGLNSETEAVSLDGALRELMHADHADFTSTYFHLHAAARGNDDAFLAQFEKRRQDARDWLLGYRRLIEAEEVSGKSRVSAMTESNPLYIPRNHIVERALEDAEEGDLELFHKLLRALQAPFEERAEFEEFSAPPGAAQWSHVTFCGT